MIKIVCVLPGTEAIMEATGGAISTASVPSNFTEAEGESIKVTRGAVCYVCDDGTFVTVTPGGSAKTSDLWPVMVAATPVAEPVPAPAAEPAPAPVVEPPASEPEASAA